MKKILSALVFFAVLSCLAQCPAMAFEFSADMISRTSQGSMNGKAYVSAKGARIEMPGIGATITRTDKKVVWVLMDKERMYMEQQFDPRTASSISEKVEGEIERALLGSEAIDGRSTKKYRVVSESLGGQDAMYQWIDDATGIPLKTEAINGDWSFEYKNFKTGSQDPALFEIPAGYKKFAMPTMDDIKAMMGQAAE